MPEKTVPVFRMGTVSHGTLRLEDLIPAFVDFANESGLDLGKLRREAALWVAGPEHYERAYPGRLAKRHPDRESAYSITGNDILEELFDAINDALPEGTYFGAHVGDGSDYGVWESEDLP